MSDVAYSQGPFPTQLYGRYLCCIPGCGTYVLTRAHHMCQNHWAEYGGKGWQQKPWLRWLINQAEREKHAQDRDAARTCSLEKLIDEGQLDYETMEPYKGNHRSVRYRGREDHIRNRGRPRKSGSQPVSVISHVNTQR